MTHTVKSFLRFIQPGESHYSLLVLVPQREIESATSLLFGMVEEMIETEQRREPVRVALLALHIVEKP